MEITTSSDSLAQFQQSRPQLIGLVYRMTGSRQEAEDIVQEVFIKWQQANHAVIKSPQAWLTTIATRLAIDHLKSAQVSRQTYIGPWLPEPFVEEKQTPEAIHELDQSITTALMLLLEKLSPAERASFILHDIFNYGFDEIASIIDKNSVSCRKLASRARTKIVADKVIDKTRTEDYIKVAKAFFEALKLGELTSLVRVLKSDVAFHADGGGKAAAALKVISGAEQVAQFFMQVVAPHLRQQNSQQAKLTQTWFNGAPGFLLWLDDKPVTAFSFSIENGQIESIYALRNPDKLKFFK